MDERIQLLVSELPYGLREKLRYFLDYIYDRTVDIALEQGIYYNKSIALRNHRRLIDLIFTIRMLYGFLVLGFRNYDQALQFFEGKQVDGFIIGRTSYNRKSNITTQWSIVSQDLDRIVHELNLIYYVSPNTTIDAIIHSILNNLPENPSTH